MKKILFILLMIASFLYAGDGLFQKVVKESGYKCVAEYDDIEMFVIAAEHGEINLGDYKGCLIITKHTGSYAWTFSEFRDGVEIYHPDYRFDHKVSIGIVRDKDQKNEQIEGQPIRNTQFMTFRGIKYYTTALGARKQILMFDRAGDFRINLFMATLNNASNKKAK